MKALNSLLQDQHFDTYQAPSSLKIANISSLRIAQKVKFKTPFIAGEGYFKFAGQQIFRKNNSLICKLQAEQNISLLVGKGFLSVDCFVNSCKNKTRKACEFSVKMFNKQLYGRMINNNNKICSYGNWEFSLCWKDEIQGRVKHDMTAC